MTGPFRLFCVPPHPEGDAPTSTQKAPIESTPFRPPFSLRASSTPRAGSPFSQAVGARPLVNSPSFQAIGAPPRDSSPFFQAIGVPPRDSLPFFQVRLAPCSDSKIFLDMMENEAYSNTISQNEISKYTPTHLYSEIHN